MTAVARPDGRNTEGDGYLPLGPCRMCADRRLLTLLEFGKHPVAHRLVADPSTEEFTHEVTLCFCENCGLIQLADPIPPEELYSKYSYLSSERNQPHMPRLARMVTQLPNLSGASRVIEIGSNDGTFLRMLRDAGFEKVLGIEPTKGASQLSRQNGIDVLETFFTLSSAQAVVESFGRCDLVVARNFVEHVGPLVEFSKALEVILNPGGYVLFEVPNFAFCLTSSDYGSVWEEHVNYFTFETMGRLLADSGIKVVHRETARYTGEVLIVVGKYLGDPQPPPQNYLSDLRARVLAYRDRWPTFRRSFIEYLRDHRNGGGTVAVYGAGCRACALINYAGLRPYIEVALDDQKEKQGKYLPGSHIPVLAGDALDDLGVDLCLLAVNPENEEAVMAGHEAYRARGGRFASVIPPSDRILPFYDYAL